MLHTVLGHCDLDLWPQYLIKSYPQHISHIYVATISNFVWMHQNNRDRCVPSLATVTLTSGLNCIFAIYVSCLSCVLSVHCCLVATCWERVDLLALFCDVLLCFCHSPMWYPGSGVIFDCNAS